MSLPQEFMERVVEWPGPDGPGYINLHWKPHESRGHGFRGKPFKELHDFMNMAQYASTKPGTYQEIYFCLSTQSTVGKPIHGQPIAHRHHTKAIKLKAVWMDVDVKPDKGYATIEEALDGIDQFVRAAKLPPPSALVLSGGGVHVYWISDKALEPHEWRPYAEGLKAEMLRLGLRADAGLTTDPARVLRVPGTFNNKTSPPRPVRLAHLGNSYSFASDLAHLCALAPQRAPLPVTAAVTTALPFPLPDFATRPMLPIFAANLPLPQYDSLAEGINLHNDRPLNPDEVLKGCPHFMDAGVTHGAHHSEPLWQLTLLASTWFEDGRTWAHYFSKGYPTYTRGETDTKYDQKLIARDNGTGWPSCVAFESAGCTKCKTCPYHGKLRSPLNLAERVQPPVITITQAPSVQNAIAELQLPAGYTVDDDGFICQIGTEQMGNGVEAEKYYKLFQSHLRNPVLQRGNRKINFETSLDGGTWGPVSIYEIELTTEIELVRALRKHGVKPCVPNQRRIATFMTDWTTKLDAAARRIDTIPFGWLMPEQGGLDPIGFAYGGKVAKSDGTEQTSGFSDEQIEHAYKPIGDATIWPKALKVITDQKYPPIEAIVAMSFGAPLMKFCDIYNAVLAPWSPESGVGKSTSIQVAAAVWGCPKITKERPLSSVKGILKKLDLLKNLPVFMDEISTDEKLDEIRDMLGMFTEGGGASRLKTNRDLFKVEDWQALMLVASNKSLCDNVLRNSNGTDAQLMRIFEFQVSKRPDTMKEADVSRLMAALDNNYGHMGERYAKLIGSDPVGIGAYVRAMREKFDHEVGHAKEERFHSALAVAIYCGAELANTLLPEDTRFHLPELWDWLKDTYTKQRQIVSRAEIVSGSAANTLSVLTEVFKRCVQNTLWIENIPMRKKGQPEAIARIAGPMPDRPAPIHIRCSVKDATIEISKRRLDEVVAILKASPLMVSKAIKQHFNGEIIHKIDLAVGSGIGGGRETIIRLPVGPKSPFLNVLHAHTPINERPPAPDDEPPAGVTATVTPPPPAPAGGVEQKIAEQRARDDAAISQSSTT